MAWSGIRLSHIKISFKVWRHTIEPIFSGDDDQILYWMLWFGDGCQIWELGIANLIDSLNFAWIAILRHSSKICLIHTPDILKLTSWEVNNYIDIKSTPIKAPQRCNFLWTLWMGWCTGWEVARTSNQDLEEWGGKEGGGRIVVTYICPTVIIYLKGTYILSFYTKWE